MPKEKNAGIFISGDGTTMESGPLAARKVNRLGVNIPVVISSNPDARGLGRARAHKIQTEIVDPRDFRIDGKFSLDSQAAYEERINEISDNYELDMAILMGWKAKLSDRVIGHIPFVMGTHPGPLPETAKGFGIVPYETMRQFTQLTGRNNGTEVVVQRLYPGRGWDEGPILGSRRVPILGNDTGLSLQARGKLSEGPLVNEVIGDLLANRLTEQGQVFKYMQPGEEVLLAQADQNARVYAKQIGG